MIKGSCLKIESPIFFSYILTPRSVIFSMDSTLISVNFHALLHQNLEWSPLLSPGFEIQNFLILDSLPAKATEVSLPCDLTHWEATTSCFSQGYLCENERTRLTRYMTSARWIIVSLKRNMCFLPCLFGIKRI